MTTKFRTIQSKYQQMKRRTTPMSQSGTIVHRKADTFIPNEYAEKLLAANTSGWGAAMIADGELQLNSADEGMSLEFLQETMKAFADKDITFYFCNSETGLSVKDICPHVLVVKKDGDEEIPQIVAFIEGNFPGYVHEKSSHPPEYHLAVDYLIPKLEGLYEMADGDLDKVTEQLKKPYFQKELLLTSVSRGTITLVAANGTSLTFAQNDLSAEYPWGWVSNTHGYTVGAKKEEPTPPKKKSMFPSRSTVREAAPSAAIAEAVVPPKIEATAIKNYSVRKERPPATLSRKERKNWYKQKIGYLPDGHEGGVSIDVYVDANNKVMTFSQVKQLGLNSLAVQKLANNPSPVKDTDPEHIPQGNGHDKEVTAEILPVMSPKTREHIHDMLKTEKVKKIIAENAEIIVDPKIVEGLEVKFADFSKQLGAKSMDEYAGWSYEMMYELAKTRPDGLATMCFTFRNLWLKSRTPEVKQELKNPDVPVKKSMFPKRDAA